MITISNTPQIYIACLASYNAGQLVGKWFDVSAIDTYDDFLQEIADYFEELDREQPLEDGCKREEWAIHDYEFIDSSMISEYGCKEYFDYRQAISNNDITDEEAFEAYCSHFGYTDYEQAARKFEDAYSGDYTSSTDPEYDFAEQLFDDCYLHEVPESVRNYIDYDRFKRDLFCGDYVEIDGYIFRNI